MHSNPVALILSGLMLFFSTGLIAAPDLDLWEFWLDSNESSQQRVDHSLWQQVLERHIQPEASGINLFDYASALEQSRGELEGYLSQMQALDPRLLSRAEQKAYWINLYNALTVQLILDNYPVKTITRLGQGLFQFGPWDDEIAEIAGQKLSLNDIEHRILRPIWLDPRIHFAVNCASMGCPNLQARAFTAENTEGLLEFAAAEFLRHPRALYFRPDGQLQLSSIFDWYKEDFGDDQTSRLVKLSAYAPEAMAEKLQNYRGKIVYDYDWQLNEVKQ